MLDNESNDSVEAVVEDVVEGTVEDKSSGEDVSVAEDVDAVAEIEASSSDDAAAVVEVSAESEEELVEELEKAEEDGASKEDLTNMVRQYTLKVNNKEYVRELDLNDDDAVKRALQMEIAGRQAMQSNSDMKKTFDDGMDRLRTNPWEVLEELGLDPIELSAKKIEDYLAQKSKSPEIVEQERRALEYNEMKARIEAMEAEKVEKERASEMASAEKEIESDIITALDGDTDLEASPEVINMVVDNMLWAMKNGFQDVTANDVIPTVKAEIQKKYRAYAKSMKSPTALKALLGDDILNNLREERVEKIKNQVKSVNNIKATSKVEKKEEKKKKSLNLSDFMSGRAS